MPINKPRTTITINENQCEIVCGRYCLIINEKPFIINNTLTNLSREARISFIELLSQQYHMLYGGMPAINIKLKAFNILYANSTELKLVTTLSWDFKNIDNDNL